MAVAKSQKESGTEVKNCLGNNLVSESILLLTSCLGARPVFVATVLTYIFDVTI